MKAWYSGEVGPSQWLNQLREVAGDVRRIRRGWRAGQPRPAGWPPPGEPLERPASDLSWARSEPVRAARLALQQLVMLPVNNLIASPSVEGRDWVRTVDGSVIFASNHMSHADTPLLLQAIGPVMRENTVVAAAADYFYSNRLVGRLVSLWLNTFPFARSGGAQEVLASSNRLLRSGWNLLVYPEGTRSRDGRLQEFKPGVGHLAVNAGVPVVPVHIRGTHLVMPKGRNLPLPAHVDIKIGKPLLPDPEESVRAFAGRVEKAVQELAARPPRAASDAIRNRSHRRVTDPRFTESWIARWRASSR